MPADPDPRAMTPEQLLAEYAWAARTLPVHLQPWGPQGRRCRDRLAAAEAELLRRLALVPPDAPAPEEPPRG